MTKSKIVCDGRFEVFDDGSIYRFKKDGTKEPAKIYLLIGRNKNNPKAMTTSVNGGKQIHVYPHRLIAEAFVPNPHNYQYVEMIDGDCYNFHPSNLRWMSSSERVKKSNESRRLNDITCPICGHKYYKEREECPKCAAKRKIKRTKQAKKDKKLDKIQEDFKDVDVDSLEPKFKEILVERLKGRTLEDIGQEKGVTRERVRQMLLAIKRGRGKKRMNYSRKQEYLAKLEREYQEMVDRYNAKQS